MSITVASNLIIDDNRNVVVGNSLQPPLLPSAGTIFFNDKVLQGWNGTSWVDLTTSGTGNVWSTGFNGAGELGIGNTYARSSPVSVIGGFTDWLQAEPGANGGGSIGLRSNGTAWAWGSNFKGKLGTGNVNDTLSPVSVVGGFTNWTQMTMGPNTSGGIRSNGTAWMWGNNDSGQVGDNTVVSRSSPVQVVGGFTDWVQISVYGAALAVRSNGTAWGWGFNVQGQLGDGTTTNRSSPVSVAGGFTDWLQVSVGSTHGSGIRSNGTAWCWGRNNYAQLGNGNTINTVSPVSVAGGFTDWVQINAGSGHTAAIRSNGTAWCWGRNWSGGLGDGTITNRSSPVSVVGGFTDWVQISSGELHTMAIRANGTAWGWGSDFNGQLGNDFSSVSRSSPVSVVGGFTDWIKVSTGSNLSMLVRFSS